MPRRPIHDPVSRFQGRRARGPGGGGDLARDYISTQLHRIRSRSSELPNPDSRYAGLATDARALAQTSRIAVTRYQTPIYQIPDSSFQFPDSRFQRCGIPDTRIRDPDSQRCAPRPTQEPEIRFRTPGLSPLAARCAETRSRSRKGALGAKGGRTVPNFQSPGTGGTPEAAEEGEARRNQAGRRGGTRRNQRSRSGRGGYRGH